jgi:hypothetical protein
MHLFSRRFLLVRQSDCPVDGLFWRSTCYRKYYYKMSWFDASNECLTAGGSLAIFSDLGTPAQDASLTAWLNMTTESYWIGLVRTWWTREDAGK